MADVELITKRGDRATAILVQLKRGDGTIVDLTGIPTSSIEFHFEDLDTGTVVTANATTIVAPATDGKVSYSPTASDVANVADKDIEVQVDQGGGITETFPVCDQFIWNIVADIA